MWFLKVDWKNRPGSANPERNCCSSASNRILAVSMARMGHDKFLKVLPIPLIFLSFFMIFYHRILNIVPCAIQNDLVVYPIR